MDLPKNEKVFLFEHTGSTSQFLYTGQFTVKCVLNIADKRILEIEKTKLQSDFVNPTDDLRVLADILANLKVRVIDAPEWWKQSNNGATLLDQDALIALFYKVIDQEVAWREELLKLKAPAAGN
jgi:hypothetical protein